MKRSIFTAILLFSLLYQNIAISGEKNHFQIGSNFLGAKCHWENLYSNEIFDDLGWGFYYSPFVNFKIEKFLLHFSFLKGDFDFIGPDALTITWPDDDLDRGFHSNLNRKNINIMAGYDANPYLKILYGVKYFNLFVSGHLNESSFRYSEKGLMYGLIINNKINLIKEKLDNIYSFGFFAGPLKAKYAISPKTNYNYDVVNKLVEFKIGFDLKINDNMHCTIQHTSDLYFREVTYKSGYKRTADLRFFGVIIGIFYTL
ncbi:MAG: hypothetical protein GXO75_12030 [Calditrichaeota bacterium]|nr:hypothetical protein [Calditrichota bacterium]